MCLGLKYTRALVFLKVIDCINQFRYNVYIGVQIDAPMQIEGFHASNKFRDP